MSPLSLARWALRRASSPPPAQPTPPHPEPVDAFEASNGGDVIDLEIVDVAPEIAEAPGEPGTLWRDEAGRIRRVPPRRLLAQPLLPQEAALRFVDWLLAHELYGDRPFSGPGGIWQLYLWHADEDRRHPVPSNMFCEALGRVLPRRPVRDPSSDKRRRITVYQVAPSGADDVPLQRAA